MAGATGVVVCAGAIVVIVVCAGVILAVLVNAGVTVVTVVVVSRLGSGCHLHSRHLKNRLFKTVGTRESSKTGTESDWARTTRRKVDSEWASREGMVTQ